MSTVELGAAVKYPHQLDAFFQSNEIIIKTYPNELEDAVRGKECPDFRVTSASQFFDYMDSEIEFWSTSDPKNVLSAFSKITNLKNAKSSFENAVKYFETNNSSGTSQINAAINAISSGCLHSKTQLASFLLQYVDKDASFITGLKLGLFRNNTSTQNWSPSSLKGAIVAFEYLGVIDEVRGLSEQCVVLFEQNTQKANESYASLNEQYNKAYQQLQKKLSDLSSQLGDFFKEKEEKAKNLEKLYDEKLSLSKPAEYWKTMATDYGIKGKNWLVASVCMAIATIVLLLVVLIFVPNLFAKDSHLFDIIKNSAIVTVIASIAIYIMRLFVKMSMSSYHLARDAKEREQLVGFYLSLLNTKAITEKERAIIINSLFSRSDTGLLKGESAPVMSANVSDIVEKLNK